MEKQLTPMSELVAELDIMEEEAGKKDSVEGKAASLCIGMIKKHILDQKFMERERYEIELSCKAGLSGTPVSAPFYFENRFYNIKDMTS